MYLSEEMILNKYLKYSFKWDEQYSTNFRRFSLFFSLKAWIFWSLDEKRKRDVGKIRFMVVAGSPN